MQRQCSYYQGTKKTRTAEVVTPTKAKKATRRVRPEGEQGIPIKFTHILYGK
jgi:hypothetical protein